MTVPPLSSAEPFDSARHELTWTTGQALAFRPSPADVALVRAALDRFNRTHIDIIHNAARARRLCPTSTKSS